ncbi:MAG: hypothetical protein ACREQ5_24505, partial [Candidatus Dormibacteria bacterium]
MLELEHHIRLDAAAIKSPNLCSRFTPRDLGRIGTRVYEGFDLDDQSRSKWFQRSESAMNLATQLVEAKTFPWPEASNVAFPLLTIATLQFHSRAYPAIIQGTEVVKCRVVGDDQTGQLRAKADRIGRFMSYQVLEEDEAWEEQQDRLLINLPIIGSAFKKSYYSDVA